MVHTIDITMPVSPVPRKSKNQSSLFFSNDTDFNTAIICLAGFSKDYSGISPADDGDLGLHHPAMLSRKRYSRDMYTSRTHHVR